MAYTYFIYIYIYEKCSNPFYDFYIGVKKKKPTYTVENTSKLVLLFIMHRYIPKFKHLNCIEIEFTIIHKNYKQLLIFK